MSHMGRNGSDGPEKCDLSLSQENCCYFRFGSQAAVQTDSGPTEATRGKADASWRGFSMTWQKAAPTGAAIQAARKRRNRIAAPGS